jgi:hypothetical protein
MSAFFQQRGIGADFAIRVPVVKGQYVGGGRSQFGRYLSSISVDQGFIDNVKAVLVISDNDDDPDASFAEVQKEIRSSKIFPVPDAEMTVGKIAGAPDLVVLMLPMGGAIGNLESICLQAAYSKWPQVSPHLDTFVVGTPPNLWTHGKQSKMRMQCILAATNDRQPGSGFAGHWRQDRQYQIPLDHPCFDDVSDFIENFPKLLGTG